MADYRKLAIQLIAADGKIDENEIKMLKKALFADQKITHEEVSFLIELRTAMLRKSNGEASPEFNKFYLSSLQTSFLGNGIISVEEVGTIKKSVMGDKSLKAEMKKGFLDGLKKKATQVAPEFENLYKAIK